jgi:hypothetical protein
LIEIYDSILKGVTVVRDRYDTMVARLSAIKRKPILMRPPF